MSEQNVEGGGGFAAGWRRLVVAAGSAAVWVGDLVVPPTCLGCRQLIRSKDALCPACWRQIRFITPPLCDRLGLPLTWGWGERVVSAGAVAQPPSYDRARAVAHFDGAVRDLVHAFKYGDRHDGRRLFGRWLQTAGAELIAEAELIVPVPLHRRRLFHRRYNQSGLLAQELSLLTGVPWRPDLLRRRKNTRQQVGLTEAERLVNIAGAFVVPARCRAQIAGRRVLLVDDVITTGATVNGCARVLRRAGAAWVDVLALAMVTEESRVRR